MLTAIHKATGEVLYGPEISADEGRNLKGLILDPFLRKDCYYRSGGEKRRNHFFLKHRLSVEEYERDFVDDPDCFTRNADGLVSVSESDEHREAKIWLRDYYIQEGKFSPDSLRLEHRIAMPCGRWRIADLACLYGDDTEMAIEVQLSPISLKTLTERVSDYNSLGIDSTWWLGPRVRQPELIEYLDRHARYNLVVTENTTTLRDAG